MIGCQLKKRRILKTITKPRLPKYKDDFFHACFSKYRGINTDTKVNRYGASIKSPETNLKKEIGM